MGFFGSFSGDDQAKAIKKGQKQATQFIDQGSAAQNQKYNEAQGMYKPYIDQGTQANTLYNDMLGINGVDAQKASYGTITSNPLFQNSLDQSNNAMMRYLNSRGNMGGAADLAAQRVFHQNMGNWMDRYKDQGNQGLVATNQGADITTRQGDNFMGTAATKANNAIQTQNALASNMNTGINNLFKLGGLAVGAMNPLGSMASGFSNMMGGVTNQQGYGGGTQQVVPNNWWNRNMRPYING